MGYGSGISKRLEVLKSLESYRACIRYAEMLNLLCGDLFLQSLLADSCIIT